MGPLSGTSRLMTAWILFSLSWYSSSTFPFIGSPTLCGDLTQDYHDPKVRKGIFRFVGLLSIGSAQIQPKPIEIVHKLTPGLADLNQSDGVMFAGILTYSAAYTNIFLYPDFVAVLLDRL